MWMTLFMLALVQGLVASEEEKDDFPKSCYRKLEKEGKGMNETTGLPNPELILLMCPVTKEYVDCIIKGVAETNKFFEMEDLLSIKSFLGDICDETSELHKGYANNYDCFTDRLGEWYVCKGVATDSLDKYEKSDYLYKYTDFDELDEEDKETALENVAFAGKYCLLNAHTYACIGMKTLEACGPGAYDTYVEVMQRARLANDVCDNFITEHFVKAYLDFLANDKKFAEIDMIRDIFDVKSD